jgi:hypothetical protein
LAAQIVAVRRKPSGNDTRDASPDGSRPGRSNCDDTGKLNNETGEARQIISIPRRSRSLPKQLNAPARRAQWYILVVWEDATGRFHASLAFRREAFDRIGGWPLTKRGDFDQQLIARLTAIEAPGDPCQLDSPSYIFRWSQTNAYHGQAFMRGPEDEGWYERVAGLQA